MHIVCVNLKIAAGKMNKFLPLMRRQAKITLKMENYCHQFDVCWSEKNRNEIFLYEAYEDAEAFSYHLETDHFLEFDRSVKELIESKTVRTFQRIEP